MRRFALLAVPLVALAAIPVRASSHDIRSLPTGLSVTNVKRSNFGEPSISLSAKDHVFICGPTGFPGGGMGFIRSADWVTFDRRDIIDRGGGGDCHMAVGSDAALYITNLQVVGSAIRKSVDDGVTFSQTATEDLFEQDRQWLATDPQDPNVVYHAYHEWAASAIVVAKSIDGGFTFPIHTLASTGAEATVDGIAGRTIPGPIRVDPTNHLRLYIAWSTLDAVGCTSNIEACAGRLHNRIVVGRSDDGGLTWSNHVAMTAPPGSRLGDLIPWISLDRAGNVYVVASGRIPNGEGGLVNGLFLASSADQGASWNGPIKVNGGTGATVFPTVAAGAAGRVDFSWVESNMPGPDDVGTWTVRFAQSLNALDASPVFSELTGPVVHNGDVCTRGIGCLLGGNRELLDFMDMAIDSFGYAHLVTASTVNGRHVVLWRQETGPSLYTDPCPAAGEPGCVTVRPGPIP